MEESQPPRRTEFHPRYKAGSWASRIATQDLVAAIIGVEVLAGTIELIPDHLDSEDIRMAFEAREDLELRWDGGTQFISIKDKQVDFSDLRQALANLEIYRREVEGEQSCTLRLEVSGLTAKARSFYEDVRRLRGLHRSEQDHSVAAKEFTTEHGISAELAEALVVAERRIGQSVATAAALFAHAVRAAVKVFNYDDADLDGMFEQLATNTIPTERQNRGILVIGELKRTLVAPLIPLPVSVYEAGYVRTQFGYIQDEQRKSAIATERRIIASSRRSLMRQWRRHSFVGRLRDAVLRGPVSCLACGHALLGNFNGRNGIVCPDCGYQPFLSLFCACECGNAALVQSQPDLTALEIVGDAIRLFRRCHPICMGCGRAIEEERFVGRLFTAPIPYPLLRDPSLQLIAWRKKLGWDDRGRFVRPEQPGLTAREVLFRTKDEVPEVPADRLEEKVGPEE